MKDKMEPKAKKQSLEPAGENVVDVSKRKAPSPLAIDTSTTNTPKRLRILPPSTLYNLPTPTPTNTNSIASSPSTLLTPQTPSTPTPAATSKLSARKQRTIHDPFNISIYDLRKQGLDWNDIATKTNAKCNLTGTEAELSGMACYSRFFRNGPLIARERGEGFQKEWYLHMRGPVGGVGEGDAEAEADDGEETESGEDEIEAVVLSVVEKAKSEFWDKVTAAVNEQLSGKTLTAEEVKVLHRRLEDRED